MYFGQHLTIYENRQLAACILGLDLAYVAKLIRVLVVNSSGYCEILQKVHFLPKQAPFGHKPAVMLTMAVDG